MTFMKTLNINDLPVNCAYCVVRLSGKLTELTSMSQLLHNGPAAIATAHTAMRLFSLEMLIVGDLT